MTLEQRIDLICEHLPEGWTVRIDLENGAATVKAIRPDDSEVILGDDGESGVEEQMRDAFNLARDETEADELSRANAQDEPAAATLGHPSAVRTFSKIINAAPAGEACTGRRWLGDWFGSFFIPRQTSIEQPPQ